MNRGHSRSNFFVEWPIIYPAVVDRNLVGALGGKHRWQGKDASFQDETSQFSHQQKHRV